MDRRQPFLLALGVALGFAPSAYSQRWFEAPTVFPESDLGLIRAAIDMDQDGDADLVWLGATSAQVFTNDGNGKFTPAPIYTNGAPFLDEFGTGNIRPRVGDVTGDGLPDIVSALDDPYPKAKLKVLVGAPGATFSSTITLDLSDPPPSPSFGGWIRAIALGNIDADPALEIVEAHDMTTSTGSGVQYRTDVTWWDGAGISFNRSPPLSITTGPVHLFELATFDADNDGDSDVATVGFVPDFSASAIGVLPTVAGAATLGVTLPIPYPNPVLDVGDLDNDGRSDLVTFEIDGTVGSGPDTLRVRTFKNLGGLSFVMAAYDAAIELHEYTSSAGNDCGLVDLEGDGDLDAAFGYERVAGFSNDGTGVFTLASKFAIEGVSNLARTRPRSIDLDGDSFVDYVGPRAIRFGDGTLPQLPTGYGQITSGSFGEWEGDGDIDLLGRTGEVAKNDGTGNFTLLPKQFPPANPGTGKSFARINVSGDFSGDGDVDFLVMTFVTTGPFQLTYIGLTLMEDTGSGFCGNLGVVIPPGVYPDLDVHDGGFRPTHDFDGDGDLDFVAKDGVLRNDGAGMAWTFVPGGFTSNDVIDLGDFDGDGQIDLLSRTDSNGLSRRTLHLQQSPFTFASLDVITVPLGEVAHRVRFVDLDSDGDLDIAAPAQNSNSRAFVVENQVGVAGTMLPFDTADLGSSPSLALDDLDGDGLNDLVIGRVPHDAGSSDSLYSLAAYRRTGPGFLDYAPSVSFLVDMGHVTGLVDLDEDGDADAIGPTPIWNRRFTGPTAGSVRQYGVAKAGTGGAVPVLGANGPLRPGSNDATLTIRRALGGSSALLFIGFAEAAIPGVLPGAPFLVAPPIVSVPFVLPGPTGATGKGAIDFDLTPFLPTVVGLTVYHQLVVLDPGAAQGVATSEGLELHYGA